MGTPALEDGRFANLLIFDYLYVFRYFCKGKGREGKGREGKGKGKGKEKRKASLDECRQVWKSFDVIGRVWTSLDELR